VYRQTILTSVRLKGCEIVGNVGTLTTVTGGSLSVGDVKWDAITPTGIGTYDHQELGSDGNYYDASMTLVDENTLSVTVEAAGAGNSQTWAQQGTPDADEAALAKIAGDWYASVVTTPVRTALNL